MSDDGATDEHGRTGDPALDSVLRRLDDLGDRPVTEHVRVFETVHEALADRLADPGA